MGRLELLKVHRLSAPLKVVDRPTLFGATQCLGRSRRQVFLASPIPVQVLSLDPDSILPMDIRTSSSQTTWQLPSWYTHRISQCATRAWIARHWASVCPHLRGAKAGSAVARRESLPRTLGLRRVPGLPVGQFTKHSRSDTRPLICAYMKGGLHSPRSSRAYPSPRPSNLHNSKEKLVPVAFQDVPSGRSTRATAAPSKCSLIMPLKGQQ